MATANSKGAPPSLVNSSDRTKLTAIQRAERCKAINDVIHELLGPVGDMDPIGSSCSRCARMAFAELCNLTVISNADWLDGMFDVQAAVKGALGCGDGSAAQLAILTETLTHIDALLVHLDTTEWPDEAAMRTIHYGHNRKEQGPTQRKGVDAVTPDTDFAKTGELGRMLMLEATYELEGITHVVAKMAEEVRTGYMASTDMGSECYAMRAMALRGRQLNSLLMSYLDDDMVKLKDADRIINGERTLLLEGGAA